MNYNSQMIYYYNNKGKKRVRTYAQRMRSRVAQTKSRSLRAGIPFSITVDDLALNKVCPLLEIPLTFDGARNNTPSIDRIKPELGYVPGNVRIVSFKANRWKNDMSLDDAKMLVKNWHRKI